jgi:ABC-type sulfate transport system permease component
MSQKVTQSLGPRYARTYTSVAAMVCVLRHRSRDIVADAGFDVFSVESALPYSVFGLAFIITYATNNSAQNVLLPILSQVMVSSKGVFLENAS